MNVVYQLKITLRHISPPIWRRVLAPDTMTLAELHTIIQAAMGWEDAHLYEFSRANDAGRRRYAPGDSLSDLPRGAAQDSGTVALHEAFGAPKSKLRYIYDFGDNWDHDVVLEKVLKADPARPAPACLQGKRACPPEDCGGCAGHGRIWEMLHEPDEEDDYEDLLEWIDPDYDTEAFDVDEANRRIAAGAGPR